jgi:predicted RNase H-like HicB family nuclease
MNFEVEFEQETDGRWIAEIPELPGVLAYGVTPLQAGARAKALALRVVAERMENEDSIPGINSIAFANRVVNMVFYFFDEWDKENSILTQTERKKYDK